MPLKVGLDVRIERPGYDPFPQRDLGWFSYALSRPTIERTVRSRVESQPNTSLRQRCRVQEVLVTPNGESVIACGSRTVKVLARRLLRISSLTRLDAAPPLWVF